MQAVEANAKRIVREVAEECKLPLEMDKEETLHMRKSRRKKNADRKYFFFLIHYSRTGLTYGEAAGSMFSGWGSF